MFLPINRQIEKKIYKKKHTHNLSVISTQQNLLEIYITRKKKIIKNMSVSFYDFITFH